MLCRLFCFNARIDRSAWGFAFSEQQLLSFFLYRASARNQVESHMMSRKTRKCRRKRKLRRIILAQTSINDWELWLCGWLCKDIFVENRARKCVEMRCTMRLYLSREDWRSVTKSQRLFEASFDDSMRSSAVPNFLQLQSRSFKKIREFFWSSLLCIDGLQHFVTDLLSEKSSVSERFWDSGIESKEIAGARERKRWKKYEQASHHRTIGWTSGEVPFLWVFRLTGKAWFRPFLQSKLVVWQYQWSRV